MVSLSQLGYSGNGLFELHNVWAHGLAHIVVIQFQGLASPEKAGVRWKPYCLFWSTSLRSHAASLSSHSIGGGTKFKEKEHRLHFLMEMCQCHIIQSMGDGDIHRYGLLCKVNFATGSNSEKLEKFSKSLMTLSACFCWVSSINESSSCFIGSLPILYHLQHLKSSLLPWFIHKEIHPLIKHSQTKTLLKVFF